MKLMPNMNYRRIAWVGFLLVVAAIFVVSRTKRKNSLAQGVEVEVVPLEDGNKLISERDVRQAILQSFGSDLEGTYLRDLEVERMETTLEEDPFVEDADAYMDQNSVLHLKIQQREPVLRVLDNNGGNYYLDQAGKKMPPSKIFAARVLIATGNVAPYTADFMAKRRHSLKDVFKVVQAIREDEFLNGFIQQIHVNNAGELVLVPLIGDQKILLGNSRKLEDKLERLKTFYKQAMPYTGWRMYETINLKYNGQVVCKK